VKKIWITQQIKTQKKKQKIFLMQIGFVEVVKEVWINHKIKTHKKKKNKRQRGTFWMTLIKENWNKYCEV